MAFSFEDWQCPREMHALFSKICPAPLFFMRHPEYTPCTAPFWQDHITNNILIQQTTAQYKTPALDKSIYGIVASDWLAVCLIYWWGSILLSSGFLPHWQRQADETGPRDLYTEALYQDMHIGCPAACVFVTKRTTSIKSPASKACLIH